MSLLNGHVRFSGLPTMNGVLSDRYGVRLNGLREEDAGIRLSGLADIRFSENVLSPLAPKAAKVAVGAGITVVAGAVAYANYAAISGARSKWLKALLGIGGTLFALAGLNEAVGTFHSAMAPASAAAAPHESI